MSATIDIWSGEAELYDVYRPHPPVILLDILTQLARMQRPQCVVDLGSGTGLSTGVWAERSQTVIGIEPNADMRRRAVIRTVPLPNVGNVEYRDGLATQTGLPDGCADIVTCSQSLHWMEPEPTLAEVARILRPGGVFAAYDYDWPPTVDWELDIAYQAVIARFRAIRTEKHIDSDVKSWAKEQHLARIQDSQRFRYVKELLVHHQEMGNAERFVGLTLSYGPRRFLKQGFFDEEEAGLNQLRSVAQKILGQMPKPWYFSYRVRCGIK